MAAIMLAPTPALTPGADTAVTVAFKTNGKVYGPAPRSRSPGNARVTEIEARPVVKKKVKKRVQICVRRNAKRCTWLKWVWQ